MAGQLPKRQHALELITADHLVQHDEMVRIGGVLEMLKPVAVAHVAERVIVPQPLADQHHVVAVRAGR